LPVFFFVLPGVMLVALVQQGFFNGMTPSAPANPKDAYTFLVTHMLPWGLKGLVIAAMRAAAMQTCSAALNSTATLFAYDIVKRYRPQTADHTLVLVGKITTIVGTALAIVSSPIFGQKDTIFQALTDIICYCAPAITAVFLMGVFWMRATGRAAFLALVVGSLLGLCIFFLDMMKNVPLAGSSGPCWKDVTGWGWALDWHKAVAGYELTSMFCSFYLFVLCCLIVAVVSWWKPEPLKEEAKPLVWEDWREPLRGEAHGRGLGNYRILSAVVVATFIALYVLFR